MMVVTNFLSNVLNVRAGERRRLVVLYLMLFTFSTGITWGGSIAEASFMNQPGLGLRALPLIIIADALVSVAAIMIYTAFVDRIPNDRLLIGLLVGFAISIGAGRVLLGVQQPILAYTLLFVAYRASDSIFLLHWWTYVNEFYDIRAFKRLAPVILSAKTLGIMAAGVTLPLLNHFFAAPAIIVFSIVAQLVIIALCYAMPLLVKGAETVQRRTRRAAPREPFIQNIREGYRYVQKSTYLRWFAIASLALGIGAALFQSLSSQVMQATYPDATSYANFLGVMNTVGGLLTFPLQLFLMNRIINRIGVGNGMMLYPISMGVSSAALLLLPPMMFNAALGVLNRSVFRLAFRAPIMGLVYNVVPLKVRGRARAFVSGLVEPVGAVSGSLFLLLIATLNLQSLVGVALTGCVLVYIISTLATRQLYSTTLVETLQDEAYSAALDEYPVLTADPALARTLIARLPQSETPDAAFFNTRLLLEVEPGEGIPAIEQAITACAGDTDKQLAILNAMIAAQVPASDVYLTFIAHADERLRLAAVEGLEPITRLTPTEYGLIYHRLTAEPLPLLQARMIPIVMRSKTFAHTKTAHELLRGFLHHQDSEQVILGLSVAKDIQDSRYLPQIVDLLDSADDAVRLGAVTVLEAFTRRGVDSGLTINQLDDLQQDPVERIREIALTILQYTHDPESYDLILNGFRDPSPAVQKSAVQVLVKIGKDAVPALLEVLSSEHGEGDANARKLAAAALYQIQPRRYQQQVEAQIEVQLHEIHINQRQQRALSSLQYSQGARILSITLQEQNQYYIDNVFYLLGAVGGTQSATIREALESDSATMRSEAVEALEGLVSPDTAQLISALFDPTTLASFITTFDRRLNLDGALSPADALRQLIADPDDSWLRAGAVFALADVRSIFTPSEREALLRTALNDPYADVRQAARAAQRRLNGDSASSGSANTQHPNGTQEQQMISLIERIMFLKQVAIFQSIPLEPLKAIAAVCEPEFFPADSVIFSQGEESGGLYVVTSGQVAIEVKSHPHNSSPPAVQQIRLATLGVNAYFGEMSLFNNRPRSATALALQDTDLLKLSRVSFIRLVRQFPDMSLTLLDVLSQRLIEVNEQLAEK
jgi:HEAT repeat protein